MFKVVRELKAGMRATELVEVDTLLLEKLRAIAAGVLKCSNAEAITKGFKSSDMDAIVEGLQLYQDSTPGVADTIQSLKEWMTSQQKAMIYNDLLDIAECGLQHQLLTPEAVGQIAWCSTQAARSYFWGDQPS